MSITTLDSNTALIVVDLQKGILALDTCHPVTPIIDNACQLISAFRQAKLPVILVNVAGAAPGRTEQQRSTAQYPADWSQLTPELNPAPSDHIVTKKTWGRLPTQISPVI